MNTENHFDAIVIGSGIGGMAAAGLMARIMSKRVLVLERHFELGGLTHVFRRGSFSWDVGLHYVGEMGEGQMMRNLFDYLTDGKLIWNKMPPIFEKFIYPGLTVEVPDDPESYQLKLISLFPGEAKAIRKYFNDIKKGANWHVRNIIAQLLPSKTGSSFLMTLAGRRRALQTTENYLNKNFKDKKLKAVLASQWGDYGLTPDEGAFAIHSLIVNHYLNGGYYPRGGSVRIARTIEMVIEKFGGECLVNKEVQKIIVENKRAVGVRVLDISGPEPVPETYFAPIVISDAGARITYTKLLDDESVKPIVQSLERLPGGCSAVTLYLGLKESPEKLGIKGENYWINENYDHNRLNDQTLSLIEGNPQKCYLSFPSLKDNETRNHTAEIIALSSFEAFSKWQEQPWKRRDTDYYDLKEKITEGLLDLVEKNIPGFKQLVMYRELSTPLTVKHFINQSFGAIYGIPATPQRYRLDFLRVKTPVRNLYLSGSDVSSLGIAGALMGGVTVVSRLLGPAGFMKIMAEVGKGNKMTPALSSVNIAGSHPHRNRTQAEGRVLSIQKLTEFVYEIVFLLDKDVSFLPGQYAKIQVAETVWREYSIVEIMERQIKFLIDIRPGGPGSRYILSLKPGDTSQLRLPMGEFVTRPGKTGKAFVATGTGITPFIPMLRELWEQGYKEKTFLYFGCRTASDYFISRYIDGFRSKLNFTEVACVSREEGNGRFVRGRVTVPLNSLPKDMNALEYYVSGNSNMILDVTKILRAQGVKNIFTEYY